MAEIWKKIVDAPGYEVSSMGGVRLAQALGRYIYPKIGVSIGGKKLVRLKVDGIGSGFVVDRLVGAAFCPDFAPHLRAIYKNGDRMDARAVNLRWVPVSAVTKPPIGNQKKTSKLNPELVLEIREARGTYVALSKIYGVSHSTISAIKTKKSWRHL